MIILKAKEKEKERKVKILGSDKFDYYKHKERFEKWKKAKKKFHQHLTPTNQKVIIEFLLDFEKGLYTAGKPPKYSRLNNLKQRLPQIVKWLEKYQKVKDVRKTTQKQITELFNIQLRQGKIKTNDNKNYTSIPSYTNVFITFWNYYIRKEDLENNRTISSITKYINQSKVKENTFVYLTFEEFKRFVSQANYKHRVLLWFLYDSGLRCPSELLNIAVSDVSEIPNSSNMELNIRHSKTFPRKIKLLLCCEMLREYIKDKKPNEQLFPITPKRVNEYLKRLSIKVFGKEHQQSITKGGNMLKDISMYDFRHNSVVYWRPRYKKNDLAVLYRFGWKKLEMLYYYDKFLGAKDTITEQDLIADTETKTKLEKDLEIQQKQNELLDERLKAQEQMFNDFIQNIKPKIELIQKREQLIQQNPKIAKELRDLKINPDI